MEKKNTYIAGTKNSQVRHELREKVEQCMARLCEINEELAHGGLTVEEYLRKSEGRNRIDLRITQLCNEYNKVAACKNSPDITLNKLFKNYL